MRTKLLSIAILEDDLFYAEFLKQGLKNIHYPFVTNFYTREQFLTGYKKEKPDLILLDHYLHNTNGLKIIDEIKETDEDANVVFVSGQQNPEIALDALKKGALDYLEKDDKVFDNLKKIILKVRIEKKKKDNEKEFKTKIKLFAAVSVLLILTVTIMNIKY
jgi:DNA-binding NtrC family response regulator